jgi:hypothetical protein
LQGGGGGGGGGNIASLALPRFIKFIYQSRKVGGSVFGW